MRTVSEHSTPVAGLPPDLPIAWREAPYDGAVPNVYVHGVPTYSMEWEPFLARAGGIAPDLPGFGKSGKPPEWDYSIEGMGRFLEAFLDERGIERCRLVVHDWGGGALDFAIRHPERVERLVVINALVLLEGYRWHAWARVWRTPVLGECAMGFSFRWVLNRELNQRGSKRGFSPEEIDAIYRHFDHGTQRSILKHYRNSPERALAAHQPRLAAITAPALVVWGDQDRYIPAHFGHDYAAALGGETTVRMAEGSGHWPWREDPSLVGEICDFLAESP